jgi:hypothetical protein
MLRLIIFLCVTLSAGTLMAKEIFIHSKNPSSKRLAIFEDNEKVAFLTLPSLILKFQKKMLSHIRAYRLLQQSIGKKSKKLVMYHLLQKMLQAHWQLSIIQLKQSFRLCGPLMAMQLLY